MMMSLNANISAFWSTGLVGCFVLSCAVDVFAFTLNSTQSADGTAALNGTGAESITPIGGTYYWSASPSADLNLDAYYLRSTNCAGMRLDLLRGGTKGSISGTNQIAFSTYSGTNSAVTNGSLIITNAGNISCGGIDTRMEGVSLQTYGNVVIGASGNPVGAVRIGYICTGAADWSTYRSAGGITIYGNSSVKIQNQDADSGSVRGDIVASSIGKSENYRRAGIVIRHNGAFRAGTIDGHNDADNFPLIMDITLDGGSGGALDVAAISTYANFGSPGAGYGGNISISGYTGIAISNINTCAKASGCPAGNVTISNGITGSIELSGTIDLSASSQASMGTLVLANSGSNSGITLASLNLGKLKSAWLCAGNGLPYVAGALLSFPTNSPASGLLDAPYGQAIKYDSALAQNAYLTNGASGTYQLKSGGYLTCSNSLPPSVVNGGSSNVTPTTAVLYGAVGVGGLTAVATLYMGTNSSTLSSNQSFAVTTNLTVAASVLGLLPETTYYYRFYVTNALGEMWAQGTNSFSTPFNKASYLRKMKIAFSGYDKPEILTNFPALVVFSNGMSGFTYSQFASSNGWDLRFFDSNETRLLHYEIDRWGTNTNSYVWVQVPEFKSNCWIWAYWGRAAAASAPAVYTTNGLTWDSRHLAVWHMREDPSGASPQIMDSTASREHCTSYGPMVSGDQVSGVVDGSLAFNGSTKYIETVNNSVLNPYQSGTWSAWVNTTTMAAL